MVSLFGSRLPSIPEILDTAMRLEDDIPVWKVIVHKSPLQLVSRNS
jgi:hypothetical protein